MGKNNSRDLDITLYTLKKCINSIIKYVKNEYNWNEKEYFATFKGIGVIEFCENNQKLRLAIFFITHIGMMEKFLKEMEKENKPIGFGRFPGEFALEINIDDFSVIRRS